MDYPGFCVVFVHNVPSGFLHSMQKPEVPHMFKAMEQNKVRPVVREKSQFHIICIQTHTISNSHTFYFWFINHWYSLLLSRYGIWSHWICSCLFPLMRIHSFQDTQPSVCVHTRSDVCKMDSLCRTRLCRCCRNCAKRIEVWNNEWEWFLLQAQVIKTLGRVEAPWKREPQDRGFLDLWATCSMKYKGTNVVVLTLGFRE